MCRNGKSIITRDSHRDTDGDDFEEQIGVKLCITGCVGALLLILTGVISEKTH